MVGARDSSTPLASPKSCPNFTALMKTVLEKDILTNHYLNELSLFAVAHNGIKSGWRFWSGTFLALHMSSGFSSYLSPNIGFGARIMQSLPFGQPNLVI